MYSSSLVNSDSDNLYLSGTPSDIVNDTGTVFPSNDSAPLAMVSPVISTGNIIIISSDFMSDSDTSLATLTYKVKVPLVTPEV